MTEERPNKERRKSEGRAKRDRTTSEQRPNKEEKKANSVREKKVEMLRFLGVENEKSSPLTFV
jgi:hypothetical protein